MVPTTYYETVAGSQRDAPNRLAPMKLARGIEQRLENLVDGVSASVFRGTMHPVTIASRLVRQLEFLAEETPRGVQIPNDIAVAINQNDLDPTIDLEGLAQELEAVVTSAAREQGWRLVGPVEVEIGTSAKVPRGIVQCAGEPIPGPLEPWAHLISADGGAVVPLAMNTTLLGRSLDSDVRFANSEVSRAHALISRKGSRAFVSDLGSSNGTFVNGDRVTNRPVQVLPGAVITFGDLDFTLRPAS